MALVVADRVQETTTTTGTGTYTLAGAKDGFQSFAAVGNSNTTYYACTDGTDYEVGIGTYTLSSTTLARTTIIESSNSDAAVNWGAGSKDIFVTLPASKATVLDASGDLTLTGASYNVTWDKSLNTLKFADNAKAFFGAGSDLQIYHDGSNSYIQDQATGDLIIKGLNLRLKNGNNEDYISCIGDGAVTLYHNDVAKLATTSTGIDVTGTVTDDGATHDGDVTFTGANYNVVWDKSDDALEFADSAKATFGTGSDLDLYHNGTNSFITNATGTLYIQNAANDADVRIRSDNGSGGYAEYITAEGATGEVQLHHYGSEKFATKSTGVDIVSGDIRFGGSADEKIASVSSRVFLNGALGSQLRASGNTKVAATTTGVELTGTTAVTGNITVSGTVDGRDVATDGTKLDGIEAGANVGASLAVAIALG